jgi:hypothetical protein
MRFAPCRTHVAYHTQYGYFEAFSGSVTNGWVVAVAKLGAIIDSGEQVPLKNPTVMRMEACPSRPCTPLAGSSSPPSWRRLIHLRSDEAKKCRRACNPAYFGFLTGSPVSSSTTLPSASCALVHTPASICVRIYLRTMILAWPSMSRTTGADAWDSFSRPLAFEALCPLYLGRGLDVVVPSKILPAHLPQGMRGPRRNRHVRPIVNFAGSLWPQC